MYKLCEYAQDTVFVSYHPSLPSSKAPIHFVKKIEGYHVLEIASSFSLKRSHFRKENIHISSVHFRIEDHILTDQSTNGTYVNGKKETRIKLNTGDQITMSGITMYYLWPYLLSDEPLSMANPVFRQPEEQKNEIIPFSIPMIPVFEGFESFMHLPAPARSSLFMALVPSFMILSSTGVSLFVQRMINPNNFASYVMMSLSSLFMSCSFFLLGLVQYCSQNRQALRSLEKRNKMYRDYVAARLETYDSALNSYRIEFERTKTKIPYGSCSCTQMPIAIARTAVAIGALPQANYEARTDPLYVYVKEQIRSRTKCVPEWEFLRTGSYVYVHADPKEVFVHLASIASEQNRIVWIEPAPTYPFLHAACIQEQYLSFCSVKQAIAHMQEGFFYWILASEEAPRIELPENCTVLCCRKEVPVQTYDQYVEKPYLFYGNLKRTAAAPKKNIYSVFCKDLQIEQIRQAKNDLNVVIGTGNEELITIDLNGAHILTAGMTGSGKSEFLSAMLLYCVVYFRAADLQYVLIDFKGGAFGNAFYHFPHCAGQVTNLQEDQIDRFMISLQSEIRKRQHILAAFQKETGQSAQIGQYRKSRTMSHLLIVVDEFAQLKLQYPQVMNDLKEYARIGRSLGIHLILATQKPAGVVDEQIWSNSKYRICLKVNSAADSREVLSHDKASRIRQPGTFYIQESEGDEICARSFYVHDPIRQWSFIAKEEPSMTVMEAMREKVMACGETASPVILPPLEEIPFDSLLLVDRPQEQKTEALAIGYGEQMAIYAGRSRQAVVEGLNACFDDVLIEHVHFERDSLWFLLEDEGRKTIVLDFDQKWHDHHAFLHQKNIRLFYLFSQISLKDEPILAGIAAKCCADHSSADAVRSFLDTFIQNYRKEFPMTTLSLENDVFHGLWTSKRRAVQIPEHRLPGFHERFTLEEAKNYFSQPILGYDESFFPIFWNKKRKLLVCYENEHVEKLLFYLVQVWKNTDPFLRIAFLPDEEADIVILNMHANEKTVHAKSFTDALYSYDVMWAGEGFADYAYVLRKRIVAHDGSLIVFQENGVQCGSLLSIYE